MSLPEVLLWRELKSSALHFRKQYRAGVYILDFFCARANLAIEVDGISHNMGDQAAVDVQRDAWLSEHRIHTVRIAAADVLHDPNAIARSIVALALDRLVNFGKAPPPSLCDATFPSQVDGEDLADCKTPRAPPSHRPCPNPSLP